MYKRVICFSISISIIMASLVVRTGFVSLGSNFQADSGYNSYSLKIDELEPQLYYSNGERLTNNKKEYVAVIKPNEKCIGELYKCFDYNKSKEIINKLSKGYPLIVYLDKDYSFEHIEAYEVYNTDINCRQLINKSSSGLLNYIDMPTGSLKISFSVDARGRILSGDNGTLKRNNYVFGDGLTLSLNKQIQDITYNACEYMKNGCAIVMDVKTSAILACVNKPDDSFINKAFSCYSVGSVFKIIVSACALENNLNINYNCNGNIKVGDTTFSCQQGHKHGAQDLKEALANSCNCYFVNLALELGSEKLLKTANDLGFNDTTELYDGWSFKNAIMPTPQKLQSKGQLALFGFGQGAFSSTPLQICSTLCTIGNNGKFNEPTLIAAINSDKRVISEKICKKLIEYMRYVVSNGTGKNADTGNHLSAGKTATAQTGQYKFGNEMLNTWFAGLYPYDNPKYAIVIMTENGTSGSADCCPIFRTIVENLERM